jgi:RNA polymerase sigma factor (sigma-70 family)
LAHVVDLVGEPERAALVAFLRTLVAPATADAEDLAQEALLRAVRARRTYDPARPILSWLRTIAANVAIDVLRRRARVRFVSLDPAHADCVEAADDSARTAAETRAIEEVRLVSELRRALEELPDAERRAFVLFYEEGRKVDAIARLMGAPVGTVKCWLHRGRERLRVRLESVRVRPDEA